jgi:predicted HAD superfamily Cof-like phosphohydrolase
MKQREKRFYVVGEKVYVKADKCYGYIKSLDINPRLGVYKAVVETTTKEDGFTHITTKEYDLWELDKYKMMYRGKDGLGLDKGFFQVREFHKAFSHPVSYKPTMLTKERIIARNNWVQEELQELVDATDVVGQADAVIDAIYFLLGDLVEMGVKPDRLFDIVQEANMGKLHEVDGKKIAVYKEDGKVKKPDNWEAEYAPEPRLKAEIKRQSNSKY